MRLFIVMVALAACERAPPIVGAPAPQRGGERPALSLDPSNHGRALLADLDLGRPRLERPARFVFDTPSGRPEQFQMDFALFPAPAGLPLYQSWP